MKKLLTAFAVACALLTVSATSAMAADPPTVQLVSSETYAHSMDLTYVADPLGAASSLYVEFFKKNYTTDCAEPNPADYALFQSTDLTSIDTDLDDMHFVPRTLTGLAKSTAYCA